MKMICIAMIRHTLEVRGSRRTRGEVQGARFKVQGLT